MPRINLLPWREAERKRRQSDFGVAVSGALVAAIAVVMLTILFYNQMIDTLRDERIHAPNEFFRLASFRRGQRGYAMLLAALGVEPAYGTRNPFEWMTMISIEGKSNFFEKRVSEYRRPPAVTSLDFSPDGALLAVAGRGEVLLHRADRRPASSWVVVPVLAVAALGIPLIQAALLFPESPHILRPLFYRTISPGRTIPLGTTAPYTPSPAAPSSCAPSSNMGTAVAASNMTHRCIVTASIGA